MLDELFEEHKAAIAEHGYNFQFNKIIIGVREKNKWADSKIVMQKLSEKQVALLGERP
jgi:phage replication-related protein YjqB (UPF0714/DUF867 family)